MSRADVAGRVHVEDGSAAAARRPGSDAGVTLQVEVAGVGSGDVESVVDQAGGSGEREGVGALALGSSRDLGPADHVSIEEREPVPSAYMPRINGHRPLRVSNVLESFVKLHVEGELAVLAPVAGHGSGTSLDLVLGEGGLKESTSGINLDISGASRAAAAKKRDTVDLNFRGRVRVRGRHGSSQAEEGREDDNGAVHAER